MEMREAQELEVYRELMEPPQEFVSAFDWKTVVGAFFIGLVMMPGSIYLGLVAGQSMGPAAEWTTIILFNELARRSFTTLRRQEIYLLYYIAGGLTAIMGTVALSGGPFAQLIWNQYFVQSQAAAGFADRIPEWVAPPVGSPALAQRTFMSASWLPAIAVLLISQVLGRVSWFTLGYSLFRITSDVEQLPFPMAPVAAQGATALAEASSRRETWRWRVFSIGTMIGLAFGLIYVGMPTISGVVLVKPVAILPIPWIDFTVSTERFLPAAAVGISTSLASIMVGFVLPFWIVVGGFIAAVATMLVNPVLHKLGVLTRWSPGMETIHLTFANQLDFWLSFTIGTMLAIATIGVYKVVQTQRRQRLGLRRGLSATVEGRGDLNFWLALGLYGAATLGSVMLCYHLVPDFKYGLAFFAAYGFLWTPLQSYVNARMIGLTGQFIGFPMVREASFILSGYQGVTLWFAPIPLANYGAYAQRFREVELTGTRITGIIKAELLMFLIVIPCSLLFWQFIWRLAPIPSVFYPYALKFWDFQALQQSLWITATTENRELFAEAIKPGVIAGGAAFGLGAYGLLSYLGWPVTLIYGILRGMGTFPHLILPELLGALLGRYYFARRYGAKQWMRYSPVLFAGFSCGMGLIGMLAIAFALLSQSVTQMPF
ncbi:MAG: peptide transporter [Armatimonadota bacterium]